MAKSLISGLGLFVVVIAITLWLFGVFDMSPAGALATGFVGVIFLIFFARFGGFKPFLQSEPSGFTAPVAEGQLTESTSTRRLIAVGAEGDDPQALFEERDPALNVNAHSSNPIFEEEPPAEVVEGPTPTPLFGEALSQQLEADRADTDQPGSIRWDGDDPEADASDSGSNDDSDPSDADADAEHEDPEDAQPAAEGLEIDVDEDPDWVAPVTVSDTVTGSPADRNGAPRYRTVTVTPSEGWTPGLVDLGDVDAEELAASLDSIAPPDPTLPSVHSDYVSEPVVTASTGLAVAAGTDLPVVVETAAPLEIHKYSEQEIMGVVRTQEGQLVETLIDEGVLSTDGPLTDKDIRTMVFVAVSSTELIDVLTRAQQDAVALTGGGEHALGTGD